MAGDTFRRGAQTGFGVGAVTSHAVILCGQKNVRAHGAAVGELVTCVALRSFYGHMFGMVEIRLQHPAVDQDWLNDSGSAYRGRGDFMTIRAPGEVR